jgi:hypothetical protein
MGLGHTADFPVRGKLPVCVSAGGREGNRVTVELL